MMKKTIIAGLIFALSATGNFQSHAGEWVPSKISTGLRYSKDNGEFASNEWIEDKGSWYLTDVFGRMRWGWHKSEGNWYYLAESTGIRVQGGVFNINGVDYTFDSSGVWIPDEISHMKGRVYRDESLNMEFTVPDYFEVDISPVFRNVTCKDDRGSYYFYVSLGVGELYHNVTVDEAVKTEQNRFEHNRLTVSLSKVSINNRDYVKLTALDTEDREEPLCYQQFWYDAGEGDIAALAFSYNPEQNTEKEVMEIMSTARPLQ